MAYIDKYFVKTCNKILTEGEMVDCRAKWPDGTPAKVKKIFGVMNTYDVGKEFPLLTLRPINLKGAIDEVLWIYQKKSNNVNDLATHIWDAWADETGSIGKAYGYQMKIKHKYKEGEFDQVDRLLYDLKNNPHSRRIMTNLYNFEDLHEMNLYPCAYSMTFNVTNGALNMILNQRSQDMLAANAWNVAQYAALLMLFARVTNLKVGKMIHVIADAHIYDRHIPIVQQLIVRAEHKAPKVTLKESVKDFYKAIVDDFILADYEHGEKIERFEVAI